MSQGRWCQTISTKYTIYQTYGEINENDPPGTVANYRRNAGPRFNPVALPKITDGDSIRIGSTRTRFHGIDAPEAKQTCTINDKEWRCGWEVTNALANIIGANIG